MEGTEATEESDGAMIVYVDVDGTLTHEQRGRSAFKGPPRQDVLDKVKRLIAAGHQVVIWTGKTEYAKRVCELYGIDAVAAVKKPDMIVDNQKRTWARRLRQRVITPEEFLAIPEEGQ